MNGKCFSVPAVHTIELAFECVAALVSVAMTLAKYRLVIPYWKKRV